MKYTNCQIKVFGLFTQTEILIRNEKDVNKVKCHFTTNTSLIKEILMRLFIKSTNYKIKRLNKAKKIIIRKSKITCKKVSTKQVSTIRSIILMKY